MAGLCGGLKENRGKKAKSKKREYMAIALKKDFPVAAVWLKATKKAGW